MNKNLFKICFVIALTTCAASAYGATAITAGLQLGGGSYSPSNKVTVTVDTTATAYSANSQHLNGNRRVATNNTDPKMWWQPIAPAAAVVNASTSDVLSSATWTSM